MSRGSVAAAAALILGCGSTEPKGLGLIRGSFGGPIADRTAYLGVSLGGTDGRLRGRAWSSVSGSLAAGATVTGRYDERNVILTIQPDLHFGLVSWRFEGEFTNDTLKGSLSFSGTNTQRVELPRVATIPLGDHYQAITGAVIDSSFGFAQFNYGGGSFRLVQTLNTQEDAFSSILVFWNVRDLPRPGVYVVSPEGGPAPTVRITYQAPSSPSIRYIVENGRIVIEESDRYLLRGRYEMSASDSLGRTIGLRGTFSAGCASVAC